MIGEIPIERGSEDRQARELRNYRLVATALLAAFVVLFVAMQAVPANFWTLLLRAGAEAAIVGGLADWFAVTALFRRPLGLPIPHTAIVPRQKDRVGAWLGTFVVDNFLASHALAKELRAFDLVGRVAGWLARPDSAARIADRIAEMLPHALTALDDRDMRRLVATTFGNRLEDSDIASILSKVLRSLIAKGHHRAILGRALPALHTALQEGEPALYSAIERRLWYLPKRLDKYLAGQLLALIQEAIGDLVKQNFADAGAARGIPARAGDEARARRARPRPRPCRPAHGHPPAGDPGLAQHRVGRDPQRRPRRSGIPPARASAASCATARWPSASS